MVADLSCGICGTLLGWKYVEASEDNQKYKVGKFILETKRIRVGVAWDGEDEDAPFGGDTDTKYLETNSYQQDEYEISGSGSRRSAEVVRQPQSGQMKTHAERIRQGIGDDGHELDFDSQDEDECEDLFAGVWSPGLAVRRRQRKSERFRRKAGRVYVPACRPPSGVGGSQESLAY